MEVGAAEQEAHHLELELAARALRQHLEAHRAARVVGALVDGRVAAAGGAELDAAHVGDRDAVLDVVRVDHVVGAAAQVTRSAAIG